MKIIEYILNIFKPIRPRIGKGKSQNNFSQMEDYYSKKRVEKIHKTMQGEFISVNKNLQKQKSN